MAPQNKEEIHNFASASDDFGLIPEDEHGLEIEQRDLSFNLKDTIENIRNIDYSKIIWRNCIAFVILHSYCIYAVYLLFTSCMWKTIFFAIALYFFNALGITMGVHRLWSHRSYKAKLPLRIVLTIANCVAFQNSIFDWSRDHRAHHKFSETDADPHNAQRGFFFCHMGWLMHRKHPDVITKGKTLDVSDLLGDPVVMFQHNNYLPLVALFCFFIPTAVPMYFWGESLVTALMVCGFLRYTYTLHCTWLVNSLAHWVGAKPFDKMIFPAQNAIVATMALGEGWHNYHHVFPFDYRTSEMGGFTDLNFTARMIDFCAYFGWAYALKTATTEMAINRAKRTGDGTKCQSEFIQEKQQQCSSAKKIM